MRSAITTRRILFLAAALITGALAAEAVQVEWLPGMGFFLSALLLAGFCSAALGLAWALENSLGDTHVEQTPQQVHLEAQVLQLNQELEARSQEQNSELARLNVELALQMAMHQQAEAAARSSEERFRNMADNIQEGLTIFENGQLVYVNQRACEIFGDCPEGSLVQRIKKLALPEELERLLPDLQRAEEMGEFPSELQFWISHKDGNPICIREHYSSGGPAISEHTEAVQRTFVITSDVTERIQAYHFLEQAVDDRTRELSTVLEVSKKIASTLELEPLLNLILDQIQTIIPYSGAAIFTLEDGRLELVAHLVPGIPASRRRLALTLENAGRYRPVIESEQVLIIDDVRGDSPLAQAYRETLGDESAPHFGHARSWIGTPLVIHERVMGLLSLTHNTPGYYTPDHARLVQTVTNQIAVAIENARLYEKAQNLATLEERNRIARELHDSVTQLLYAISLYCTATTRSLRSENYRQVEENVVEIKDNALQALREMRLLILELNPPLLQKEGLVAALQASLDVIESRTGLETSLSYDGIERLPHALEVELYRIAMEALNNLVRYAHARKVTVDLQGRGGWVFLEIRDNGLGFDLDQARRGAGMGLHNMQQRASQLGGRIEIGSQPGEGTCIRVEAPL